MTGRRRRARGGGRSAVSPPARRHRRRSRRAPPAAHAAATQDHRRPEQDRDRADRDQHIGVRVARRLQVDGRRLAEVRQPDVVGRRRSAPRGSRGTGRRRGARRAAAITSPIARRGVSTAAAAVAAAPRAARPRRSAASPRASARKNQRKGGPQPAPEERRRREQRREPPSARPAATAGRRAPTRGWPRRRSADSRSMTRGRGAAMIARRSGRFAEVRFAGPPGAFFLRRSKAAPDRRRFTLSDPAGPARPRLQTHQRLQPNRTEPWHAAFH